MKESVHQDVASASLELTIRPYADSDWEAVCRVYGRARPIELAGNPAFANPDQASSLGEVAEAEGFFKSRTVVALADARVIGFASVEVACLRFFYIDPGRESHLAQPVLSTGNSYVGSCRLASREHGHNSARSAICWIGKTRE